MLGSMMIPGQVLMVPHYLIMSKLRWLDTYYALIIARHSFSFWNFSHDPVLERAFQGPRRSCFTRRMLSLSHILASNPPLAKPALATLVYSFTSSWHDFMSPLIYLNSVEKFTLTLGLNFFQGQYVDWWTYTGQRHVRQYLSLSHIPCFSEALCGRSTVDWY